MPFLRPLQVGDQVWLEMGNSEEQWIRFSTTGRSGGLPPSDTGFRDAIPLPPEPEWNPDQVLTDAEWAAQNRRINNLLMRGVADA